MVRLVSTVLIFLISSHSYGAIKSLSGVNLELKRSEAELSSHQKNLNKLKREILELKKNVAGKTKRFSQIISIKTNLKNEIDNQKVILEENKEILKKESIILRKVFAGILLTEDTDDEVDFRFMTIESLKEKEQVLKIKKQQISKMINLIDKMKEELNEYDFLEADLISNIEKMHIKEKSLSILASGISSEILGNKSSINKLKKNKRRMLKQREKRLAKAREKAKMDKQLKSVKGNGETKKALSKTIGDLDFELPLRQFDRIKKDKNGGVSLYVNEGKNIIAPEDGIIVYNGKLSTYGNVVVIKHKKNYQSVILGEILSEVAKRDLVKKGQVIGKIIENNGDEKKLYYELRNKNKRVSYNKLIKNIKF